MANDGVMTLQHRSHSRKPTAIDLFAGCGGLTEGLKQAGFKVLSAIEIDATAAQTYRDNHKGIPVKECDIRDISEAALRRELGLKVGQLSLLAGCPPCQGFSTLRTRNGTKRNRDSRNELVREMLRFIRAFMPQAVMMENVPRLAGYKGFREFCDGLSELGYLVNCEIKDAANYGVPQRRKRLILLAGLGFRIPFAAQSNRLRTVRSAIGRLAAPGASRDLLHNIPERPRAARVAKMIRDIPKDGGSRGDLPRHRQLKCHQKVAGFADVYGRMAWAKVAPTITSGCFNPSKGRFLHPEMDRAITMREAALLQSFPRKYFFDVSAGKEAIALMIGNALPPEFIRRHALEVKKALGENS